MSSMSASRVRAPATRRRPTQAERSARSRSALLESAARGLSRYGYGNLKLEQVAREAGYTRGALYHQFEDKEDLALAVIEWVNENWMREVGEPARQEPDPVSQLLALARGHAVFCRRDIARSVMALRVEFSGQEHPVGQEIARISGA
jgi:AcrR family transcriptional regulator